MKQILISGYIGFENFGDEALLHVLVKDLTSLGIKREQISAISNKPEATKNAFNINTVNRWNIFQILDCDVIIFIGGLFQDKTSFRSFLYYFAQLFLAVLLKKELVFYGVGIGPFQRKITRILFNFVVKNVYLITVRDQASAYLTPYKENTPVTCDPVWSIETNFSFQNKITNINWQLPIIGVSLRNDKNLKRHHLTNIADKLIRVLSSLKDWQVLLIPCMPLEDLPILYGFQDLIGAKIAVENRIVLLENFNQFSIQQQAGILASCDVMIGMRYHALLVPLASGKPVFGLIYDQKVKSLIEFSNQVGVSFKDDLSEPWSYFWQNLEHSSSLAKKALQRANQLHEKNIDLLKRL